LRQRGGRHLSDLPRTLLRQEEHRSGKARDMILLCCHESLLRRHCIERDLFGRYLGSFPLRRVGTILCGGNTTTEDFARWVLRTAETQPRGARRAPSNDPFE
jgi:hypothetical protein